MLTVGNKLLLTFLSPFFSFHRSNSSLSPSDTRRYILNTPNSPKGEPLDPDRLRANVGFCGCLSDYPREQTLNLTSLVIKKVHLKCINYEL